MGHIYKLRIDEYRIVSIIYMVLNLVELSPLFFSDF